MLSGVGAGAWASWGQGREGGISGTGDRSRGARGGPACRRFCLVLEDYCALACFLGMESRVGRSLDQCRASAERAIFGT